MSDRGIRNNNPGNIVWTGKVLFPGELGVEEGEHHVFARFDTAENGIRAIWLNLRSYQARHGLKTVDAMIRRWSTTDQDAYVANVARAVGVAPDTDIDVTDALVARRMVNAIIAQECSGYVYPPATMDAALGAASSDTQPPAPIDDRSEPYVPPLGGADNSNAVTNGGRPVGILAALLPTVLSMFQPLAAEKIARVTHQSAQVADQLTTSLFGKIAEVTGEADPIAGVAALQKDPTKVAPVEAHAVDMAAQLGPLVEQLASLDKARWAADQASADAAGTRGRADKVDIAPRLIVHGNRLFVVAILGVLAALGAQMYFSLDHKPDGVLISMLTILVYAVARIEESPFRYRFGGQHDSAAADAGTTIVTNTTNNAPKGKP